MRRQKTKRPIKNKMYWQVGPRQWMVRTAAIQCDCSVFILDRCQGVKDHEGDHWAYSPSGTYRWSRDGGGCGCSPPGSQGWVSPETKDPEYHMHHYVEEAIGDTKLIDRLENDYIPKDALFVNRPCTESEIDELKQDGRLDD